MRITIDTHVRLDNLPPADRAYWQERATVDNAHNYEASCRATGTGRPAVGVRPTIDLWACDGDTLVLPRALMTDVWHRYGNLPTTILDSRMVRPVAAIATSGTLVPDAGQEAAIEAVMGARGGVIEAPCGSGKTVAAMALIERMQTPTLFLCHTAVLFDQARARIREHLGLEPGVLGGGKWAPGPVTVGMMQTIISRAAAVRDLRDYFGMVIVDEAHHVPAETFARVAGMFTARVRVGLTATPTRKDHLEPILFLTIGPIVARMEGRSLPLQYEAVKTGWEPATVPVRKVRRRKSAGLTLDGNVERKPDVDTTALVTQLCADPARTRLVADAIAARHLGCSLVLTARVEHVRQLAGALTARGLRVATLASEVERNEKGRETKRTAVTKAERATAVDGLASGAHDVLVTTPAAAGEGFDCARIDTVFLAAPHNAATTAEQTAGRACRQFPGRTYGRLVDFVDASPGLLLRWAQTRVRVYRRLAKVGA